MLLQQDSEQPLPWKTASEDSKCDSDRARQRNKDRIAKDAAEIRKVEMTLSSVEQQIKAAQEKISKLEKENAALPSLAELRVQLSRMEQDAHELVAKRDAVIARAAAATEPGCARGAGAGAECAGREPAL